MLVLVIVSLRAKADTSLSGSPPILVRVVVRVG